MEKKNNSCAPRLDAVGKATGNLRFCADYSVPGMLHGAMLFSSHQHAKILRVTTPKLLKNQIILTGADLDVCCLWNIFPILCTDRVRSFGDVVAIAAAPTHKEAQALLGQVQVEYESLEVVRSIEESLQRKAVIHDQYQDNIWPNSHYVLKRVVEEREPARVYERQYRTQTVEHAYLETETVLAIPEFEHLRIIASAQYPFSVRKAVCEAVGLPFSQVSVIQPAVGGTFGGKEESAGLLCARAALLAQAAGKPVKMVCSREESILISSKRHPFRIDYRVGVDEEGNILRWDSDLVDDLGAYNARARNMNWRASVHAAGPYRALAWDTRVRGAFTNNLLSGAMRGYSSPQIIFAHESLIDEIAQDLGKDFIEYRKQICLKTGDRFATGQVLEELPFLGMLDAAQQAFSRWEPEFLGLDPRLYSVGKGVALCLRGCGLGAEYPDATGAQITLLKDGSLLLQSSLSELGQGLFTALAQIACQTLGVSMSRVRFAQADTTYMEDGGSTVASRGAYAGGSAMLIAAQKMHKRIVDCLAKEYRVQADKIRIHEETFFVGEHRVRFDDMVPLLGKHGLSHSVLGWFSPEAVVIDHATGQGNAYADYSYGCVAALSVINRLTGGVAVKKVLALHDVGKVIHRDSIENQIYGGIAMGLGFALMEDCTVQARGLNQANLDSYIIPTAMDMPDIEIKLLELPGKQGPFGAKSVGEPATEAAGAAIARSVANGIGRRVHALPLTQEAIVRHMREQEI